MEITLVVVYRDKTIFDIKLSIQSSIFNLLANNLASLFRLESKLSVAFLWCLINSLCNVFHYY